MSVLYRTGNNRNDIVFINEKNREGRYMHKTSWTGRESLQWMNITSSMSAQDLHDAVLLQRTGTGRNDLVWQNNYGFTFVNFGKYKLGAIYKRLWNCWVNITFADDRGATSSSTFKFWCSVGSVGVNSLNGITTLQRNGEDLSYFQMKIYFATKDDVDGFYNELIQNYTKVSINPKASMQNIPWKSIYKSDYAESGDKDPNTNVTSSAYFIYFNLGEYAIKDDWPTQVIFS